MGEVIKGLGLAGGVGKWQRERMNALNAEFSNALFRGAKRFRGLPRGNRYAFAHMGGWTVDFSRTRVADLPFQTDMYLPENVRNNPNAFIGSVSLVVLKEGVQTGPHGTAIKHVAEDAGWSGFDLIIVATPCDSLSIPLRGAKPVFVVEKNGGFTVDKSPWAAWSIPPKDKHLRLTEDHPALSRDRFTPETGTFSRKGAGHAQIQRRVDYAFQKAIRLLRFEGPV
jgi:hypothetical protein